MDHTVDAFNYDYDIEGYRPAAQVRPPKPKLALTRRFSACSVRGSTVCEQSCALLKVGLVIRFLTHDGGRRGRVPNVWRWQARPAKALDRGEHITLLNNQTEYCLVVPVRSPSPSVCEPYILLLNGGLCGGF